MWTLHHEVRAAFESTGGKTLVKGKVATVCLVDDDDAPQRVRDRNDLSHS